MTPHIARARGLAFIALLVMAALVPSRTARALSPTPSQSALCNMPARAGVARHYTVTGRIKLLLIWTGRRDVGAALRAGRGVAVGVSGHPGRGSNE